MSEFQIHRQVHALKETLDQEKGSHEFRPENDTSGLYRIVPTENANIVTSMRDNFTHVPLIDLDLPCRLEPSSTPGHFHLYIEKEMTFSQYLDILATLQGAGVVERGFVAATRARGFGALRKPGTTKPGTRTPLEESW